jgi:acyl-coenzyme A synthetase/AMP-(fatty) acid ligase
MWLMVGWLVGWQIPKSLTGKVLRRVLQDEYEQRVAREVKGKL